jgi:futalosine hydrolase
VEKPVIVIAATHRELSLLAAAAGIRQSAATGSVHAVGMIGSRKVIIAATGIGTVNTAIGLTILLEQQVPELVVVTGCAGAYGSSGLKVGDLALATAEIYGDEGVETLDGWESLRLIGIPLAERDGTRYFNEFPLSSGAGARAGALAATLGVPCGQGPFVTVSTCSGTRARGDLLERRFGAIAENMEGAAAAHVALRYGVECLELRGISNLVEDRDLSRWDISLAVENAQRLVLKFIETMEPENPRVPT